MPAAPKLLATVSCPEITWSTTSVIRWELKCEPGSFIEIPLGVFLAIAVGAENEAGLAGGQVSGNGHRQTDSGIGVRGAFIMTNEQEQALSQCYAARGYLVITLSRFSPAPLTVGEVITSGFTQYDRDNDRRQPLRITGETDLTDFLEQCDVLGAPRYHDPDYDRFYRVESD
jgi:hypothetical protein